MSARIGFIGTGSMGEPIARNLLRAGYELAVHDRREDATATLVEAGAAWRAGPAAVADGADIVFLSLPSHVEVEAVCFGAGGVFETLAPGAFLVDLTTGSVQLIPRLVQAQHRYGIRYLAAPVSQGVDNAHLGRLSVFIGGDRQDVEACRPVLEAIATVIIHTGDQFSAMASKLLTNLLWFINAAAIGEALVLGAKSGVDLLVLREVIRTSCGTSWVAEHDLDSIYSGWYDTTFSTALCRKDLALVGELATMLDVPIRVGATVETLFAETERLFGGQSPELSVVRRLETLTGVSLQVPPHSSRLGASTS